MGAVGVGRMVTPSGDHPEVGSPVTLDSYRGVPLAKKLGIRAGSSVALIGAPPGFEEALGALPEGACVLRGAQGNADVVLLLVTSQEELERGFATAAAGVAEGGRLWVV